MQRLWKLGGCGVWERVRMKFGNSWEVSSVWQIFRMASCCSAARMTRKCVCVCARLFLCMPACLRFEVTVSLSSPLWKSHILLLFVSSSCSPAAWQAVNGRPCCAAAACRVESNLQQPSLVSAAHRHEGPAVFWWTSVHVLILSSFFFIPQSYSDVSSLFIFVRMGMTVKECKSVCVCVCVSVATSNTSVTSVTPSSLFKVCQWLMIPSCQGLSWHFSPYFSFSSP